MAYMRNIDYREVANARMSSRVRQVLILGLVVIIGMLISVSVNVAG